MNGLISGYLLLCCIASILRGKTLKRFLRIGIELCLFMPIHTTLASLVFLAEDNQKGALKLLFHLLCIQPKKGDGENDMNYLFAQYKVH